ncbi:MAG: hypothetical protein WKF97_07615 [Chitinophagaceae bacterium]
MKLLTALAGGLAGACALTLLHETARRMSPEAPRMDLLGMDALSRLLENLDLETPGEDKLFTITMAGDLVGNALYYSLAGVGKKKHVWKRGVLLGLGAGLGAVVLPKPLGLDEEPSNRTAKTQAMTVAWYLAGGIMASAVMLLMKDKKKQFVF